MSPDVGVATVLESSVVGLQAGVRAFRALIFLDQFYVLVWPFVVE